MITNRTRIMLAALTATSLVAALLVGTGSGPHLACAGESSLKFVGNLIRDAQNISLDRLDPTCPQCI